MVIEDDEYLLIRIYEGLAQQRQKPEYTFLIGGSGLHEDRLLKACTYRSKHSNASASELGEGMLDGVIGWGPCARVSHPHVKRRLVEVNERHFLLDQSG